MNLCNALIVPQSLNHLTKLILFLSLLTSIVPVHAIYYSNFVKDSELTGNVFFWNRDRERKNVEEHKYEKKS